MKAIISTIVAHFLLSSLSANNVEITGLTQSGNILTFEITWENSWRSGLEFHDAVWIFVKQAPNGGPSWIHGNVSSGLVAQGYELIIPSDQVGVFLRRDSDGNGTASAQVQLTIDNSMGAYRDYKVFAMEMVYVPEESFYIGDGYSQNRFHRGDSDLLSYHVTSEGVMTNGSTINDVDGGGIYNDIPASFPKGFDAFYSMKYPITTGQYVDFLNCQDRASQDSLVSADLSGTSISERYVLTESSTPSRRNPVACDLGIGTGPITFYCDGNNNSIPNENDDGQARGVTYVRSPALMAFLDWSGLAPMTTFEYEKACRGPLPAIAGEFSWGSDAVSANGSLIDAGTNTEKFSNSGIDPGIGQTYVGQTFVVALRVGCHALTSGGDREKSGASYYGILDLSFYSHLLMDEYYMYTGQHGDGSITNGRANSFGSFGNLELRIPASIQYHPLTINNVSSNQVVPHFFSNNSGRGVRRI